MAYDGDTDVDELEQDQDQDQDEEQQPERRGLLSHLASAMGIGGTAPIASAKTPPFIAPAQSQPSITGASGALASSAPVPTSVTAQPLGGTQPIVPPVNAAEQRLQTLEADKPAVTKKHGLGGGILNTLDVLGSAIAPGITSRIPGTRGNYQRQIAELSGQATEQGKLNQEQAQEQNLASNLASEAPLRQAQANEANTRADVAQRMADNVPVTLPSGQTVFVPQKDAEKLLGTGIVTQGHADVATQGNQTKKDIATEGNESKEKIAGENVASREKVALWADDTRKLISQEHESGANERAAMATDPNKLTNTMRTMMQQAQATLPQIDKAITETVAVKDLLGPGAGRWNDFMQGRIGVSDPRFAHYRDEIHMVSTAVTLAHARGRISNELYESFQKMFDAGKQSADNMIQALDVSKEWLEGYAQMGQPRNNQDTNLPGGGKGSATSGKTYTDAEVQAAAKANGMKPEDIEAAYKAKGYQKQ